MIMYNELPCIVKSIYISNSKKIKITTKIITIKTSTTTTFHLVVRMLSDLSYY